MDNKKYNQMGFDFGDSGAEQETPAAGFRIKQLKPASNTDTGEQEQEIEATSAQSEVNGQTVPSPVVNTNDTPESGQTGLEDDTAKQQTENDPHNDSEVLRNTPVTSEAEAIAQQDPAEEPRQAHHQAEQPEIPLVETQESAPESEELAAVNTVLEEEEKAEKTAPEAPVQAEKPADVKQNIPGRLTRPTQVYAVEEAEPDYAKKNKNAGFTPASEDRSQPNAVSIAEESIESKPVAVQQSAEAKEAEPEVTAVKEEETPQEVQQPQEIQQIPAIQPAPVQKVAEAETPTPAESDADQTIEEPFIIEEPEQVISQVEPAPELPKKSTRGRKSLKTLDAEAEHMNIPEDSTLFKRQYYSIGEVAGMFGVNQSLLRFWENEFDLIQPRKNRKGDRHFRPVDIKNLELIYDLLRRRKLTIEGAKEFLKKNKSARERFEMIQSLQQIRGFMLEIKASL